MIKLITFRPTAKVWKYLSGLKNKSKEINDIIENYIINPWSKETIQPVKEIESIVLEQIEENAKLEREEQLFKIPEVVRNKAYYDNLHKYTTIKNMWWCFTSSWEWLDTQEALEYAKLQLFIP